MSFYASSIRFQRKLIRRLNWKGLFVDVGKQAEPVAVLAGYTRSGTTFLGRVLANILHARPIHEPLNPASSSEVSFFNERESRSKFASIDGYHEALRAVLSKQFKGSRLTNTGSRIVYHGRVVKVVRANHYADYLSDLLQGCPFVVIMRNPCACISSRLKLDWPVPDHTNCFPDIEEYLSQEQKDIYLEASEVVTRLAISWCLDNLMLLRNSVSPNFLFVHYENILTNPEKELTRILRHVGAEHCVDRIERELRLEWGDSDGKSYLSNWRDHLTDENISEIYRVLRVFGLASYYNVSSGLPLGDQLFSQ